MRIAVIGAGMAGILMGVRLRQAGFDDFVILEKASAVGGTWRDNIYPGVACDVPAHLYAYAGEPNPDWSSRYPAGAEIRAYVERVAQRHGLGAHLRFGQEVASADWSGAAWRLETAAGVTLEVDAVIAATGTLHHPRLPALPGLGRFAGPVVHTARWPPDLAVEGRAVGVVGTGSSAAQLVPALAGIAARITVFQRTPAWSLALANPRAQAWLRRLLQAATWLLHLVHAAGSRLLVRRYGGAFVGRRTLARRFLEHRARRALRTVRDPALRRALTPDYPPGCKRLVFTDRYLPALERPDVALVTPTIAEVCPTGIRTADGTFHPLDLLVLATGFDAQAYLRPMAVTGTGGVTLDALWRERPIAYLGVALPDMPNFFLLAGPHSPIANLSVVKVVEWQSAFILRCLTLGSRERVALSPRWSAVRRDLAALDAAAPGSVWAAGCRSWYLDATGRPGIYTRPPWHYRAELARGPDPQDFERHHLPARA